MFKRRLLRNAGAVITATVCALTAVPAMAENYPNKPIRILVSFSAGGLTDLIARALQPELQKGFGQPVVVENRPGAGGTVAEGVLAKAAPDGYTILLSADSVPANPHLMPKLPYDSFKDLQPVSMLAHIPLVMLVNNAVPANTLEEFIEYTKTTDEYVSYGSPGIGTSNHLYFEVLKELVGMDVPHVPYKGGNPAITDLLGGHIQALLISGTLATPPAASGKAKALAISRESRLAQLPDVPTFGEAGLPDFMPKQWTGLFVPSGTDADVVARIHHEFANALKAPEVIARLDQLNAEPVMSSQEEFVAHLSNEYESLGSLIKARGITAH